MSARHQPYIKGRRSPVEWVIRSGLAMVAAIAAYVSVTHSLAYVIRQGDPARAYALVPEDARAAALLARQLSGSEGSSADRLKADRLAKMALRRDPTVVAAAATLGLNAQLRGDTGTARRLFGYSDLLSRRDLLTRLWLIEDAVSRKDIAGALRNYDIALRTSRDAPELLYPVLANASNDAAIMPQLVQTLASRPLWAEGFIGFLAVNGSNPSLTARLFRALSNRRVPIPDSANAIVINTLITNGHVDDAWNYYVSIHPDSVRNRSRDPEFTAKLETPSSLDWKPLSNDSGLSATIERSGSNGLFDFIAITAVGGVVLEQTQLLPPGSYILKGQTSGIDQPIGSRPYWVLACVDGREIGRVELYNSAEADGKFSGVFTVKSDCSIQQLRLVVRASNMVSGVSGQVGSVALRPAG